MVDQENVSHEIVSEELIDSPFVDECTVENAMYPFKLVLSPAEERPLQIGKSRCIADNS